MTIILQRLSALRRHREKRALEAVTVQAGLLRQAEQQAENAARSARDHVREARARERELIGALAGRAVSPAAILRTQTEIDRAALETDRLRAEAVRAQADVLTRRNARAQALADFQLRQRATAKIDLVCKQETAWQSRRDAALGDAEYEDHRVTIPAGRLP